MNLPNVPEDQPTLRDIAYRFGTVQQQLDVLAANPNSATGHALTYTLAYAEEAVADLRKIAEVAP